MSLINQMLRDLEKRRAETEAQAGLSEHIHITAAPRSTKLPALSWALLALLTTSVGYWSYRQFIANNAQAPALSTKVSAPGSISNDKAVSQTQLIRTETNSNPIALGSKSLAPAEPVPTITSIATTAAISAPTTIPAIPAALPAATEHIDAGNPAKDSTAVPPKTSATVAPPLVTARSIRPKPGKISNTGPQQQAELLYRQALRNNDRFLMVPALERVLVLYPQHLNARLLLAKTLHDLGQINKTAEFLDQSLALFPNNLQFVNTRAQIFLQQKNPRAALGTL
ncbi:MAG: tetratricopeptide repeat protein, partial [Methylococcales bacterium]